MTRHVLILEGALTGHHSMYLQKVGAMLLEEGHSVTVSVVARDCGHASLVRLKDKYGNRFAVHALEDNSYDAAFSQRFGEVGRELRMRWLLMRAFREVSARRRVDEVMLPYLDYCLYAIALLGAPFGRVKWSGICMRPSFHYGRMGVIAPRPRLARAKAWLFSRLLGSSNLKVLFTIDELLHQFVENAWPNLSRRFAYLPDPAEFSGYADRRSARLALGLPDHARAILCYGAIDRRKGLDALISAAMDLPLLHLLVVGKQSPWARDLLRTPSALALLGQQRLHIIDSFVDEDMQQRAFVASDAVWLGYREHYTMSGVLVLAAVAGRPVVASDEGLIGWYVNRYRLGTCVKLPDGCDVRAGLKRVVMQREGHIGDEAREKFGMHTWQNFSERVRSRIECPEKASLS